MSQILSKIPSYYYTYYFFNKYLLVFITETVHGINQDKLKVFMLRTQASSSIISGLIKIDQHVAIFSISNELKIP